MPDDAAARIAYHRSPTASSIHSTHSFPFPAGDSKARQHLKVSDVSRRSMFHFREDDRYSCMRLRGGVVCSLSPIAGKADDIQFEEQDVVHQYDPQSARHFSSSLPHGQLHVNTANLHAIPPHLASHRQNSYGPSSPGLLRNPSVFTVAESPDEYDFTVKTAQRVQPGQSDLSDMGRGYEQGSTRYSFAPDQHMQYADPYANLRPLDSVPRSGSADSRSRRGSGGAGGMFAEGGFVRSLGSIFNFHPNPDLSLRPPPSPRSGSPARAHNASLADSGGDIPTARDARSGSGSGSCSGSRRTSDNKDKKTKGARGSEEEERRGLVEAGRMSEEMADIGYGGRGSPGRVMARVMGPREAPASTASAASAARGKAQSQVQVKKVAEDGEGTGGKGEKGGLERIETVLDHDDQHQRDGVRDGYGEGRGEEGWSSPEASPVRPAHSGF